MCIKTDNSTTAELHYLRQQVAKQEEQLAMQDQQLDALRQKIALLEQFVKHAPVVMAAKDLQGQYIMSNSQFGTYCEQHQQALFDPKDEELLVEEMESKTEENESTLFSDRMLIKQVRSITYDGKQKWYNTMTFPIVDNNGSMYAIGEMALDITTWHESEEALRKSEKYIDQEYEREVLMTVASALRIATTRTEMIPILLDQIMALLTIDGVALILCDPIGEQVVTAEGIGTLASVSSEYLASGEGIVDFVMQKEQPYLAKNVPHDSLLNNLSSVKKKQTLACIPLRARDYKMGMLCIGSQYTITQKNLQLMTSVGDMAANALYRVTLHEQTERRLRHIQALHTIDQAIATSSDVYQTLDVVLCQVMSHLKIDATSVLLYNPVTNHLEYEVGRGFDTVVIQQTYINLDDPFTIRTVRQSRVLSLEDVYQKDDQSLIQLMQAEGFVAYYGIPLIARGKLKGVLEVFQHTPLQPDLEWLDFFNILAGQTLIAIDHAELIAEFERTNDELMLAYDATIEGLARALELRDAETEGHSRRVTRMTIKFANSMGIFSEEEIIQIRRGAILHDVGKVAIPDAILLKNGPLDDIEYAVMQLHTTYAYDMLYPIPFLRPSLDIPYCHHEKWDGTGYPQGLKGEEIPIAARMFAVVDVYDALSSNRPYRKRWSEEKVRSHIREQAGTHFDPTIVEAFLRLLEEGDKQAVA